MKCSVVPRVYTILMFGISISLWVILPRIPLVPETPVYLQHPLFTLELFSLLSTAIVWIMAMLMSLYGRVKQKISIIRSITQNLFVVFLAFITIVVAISGSIFFSKTIPFLPLKLDNLWVNYAVTPDPFGQLYGFGVLFCEGAWIVEGLSKLSKSLKNSNLHPPHSKNLTMSKQQ